MVERAGGSNDSTWLFFIFPGACRFPFFREHFGGNPSTPCCNLLTQWKKRRWKKSPLTEAMEKEADRSVRYSTITQSCTDYCTQYCRRENLPAVAASSEFAANWSLLQLRELLLYGFGNGDLEGLDVLFGICNGRCILRMDDDRRRSQ